jgi:ligand-binding sensor domain-containing protein
VVHDITTGTSWSDGYLWVATYFGLSRYDGVHWKGYFDHDSGLASNFINFIKAHNGVAYICTDKGLSTTDGENWSTYVNPDLAHSYVLGVDIRDDVVWVATSDGLSRGERISAGNRVN